MNINKDLNRTHKHNVKTLRDELVFAFEDLRDGKIGISEVKAVSNLIGKAVSSAKTQMEYNKMVNSKSKVMFLTSDE